jgi:hypothetical protein
MHTAAVGNITIKEGAHITTAQGGGSGSGSSGAAGIGGGYTASPAASITITDSTIDKAQGGGSGSGSFGAAGIGGGCIASPAASITITDSTIDEAQGAGELYGGAGIGGGYSSFMQGGITITGSKITTAQGGGTQGGAAGIGGGSGGGAVTGGITIEDCEITTAQGGGSGTGSYGGAGIGGGSNGGSVQGNITIQESKVEKAQGGSATNGGAGIGGGTSGGVVQNDIVITKSEINNATGTGTEQGAAGIGGGSGGAGPVQGSLIINSGRIQATGAGGGSYAGAGIGGGSYGSFVNAIICNGGTIFATSGDATKAQDIGNGDSTGAQANSLIIDGGSIWAANNKVAYASATPTGPKNSANSDVYANKLTLGSPAAGANIQVTEGVIDGVSCADIPDASTGIYGTAEVFTGDDDISANTSGKVCFWLPQTASAGTEDGSVGLGTGTGQTYAGYEFTYARTGDEVQTLIHPLITNATPLNTAPAALSGNITLTFNTAMDTTDAKKGSISLTPSKGTSISLNTSLGTWSQNGTVYTIPYSDLTQDMTYTIEATDFKSAVLSADTSDATHTFTTLSYKAAIDPASYDFGTQGTDYPSFAPKQFSVTNTGTETLVSLTLELTGKDKDAFVISSELSSVTIAKGEVATLSARPVDNLKARADAYEATLKVTNAQGILLEVPLTFEVASYALFSDPTSCDFGSVPQGYAQIPSQQFSFTNAGTKTLTNLTLELTGKDKDAFVISSELSLTSIAPGEVSTLNIRPQDALKAKTDSYEAQLKITTQEGPLVEIPLSFKVISYSVSISPATYDFGTYTKGYDPLRAKSFTLTNTGIASLSNLTVTFSGADASAFELSSDTAAFVQSTGANASALFADASSSQILSANASFTQTRAAFSASSHLTSALTPEESITVQIRPKTGLGTRTEPYRASLVINSAEATDLALADISVTVTLPATDTTGTDTLLPLTADTTLPLRAAALALLTCGICAIAASRLICYRRSVKP